MKQTTYTFVFATIICVVSAVLLSGISEGLKQKQLLNEELDVKKNILKSVQLKAPIAPKTLVTEILNVYETKIDELVIDDKGNVVEGKSPHDLTDKDKGLYPIYIYKEDGQLMSYAFPIVGQGLWSVLYGYLAIEADASTVRGITFYKHGETPGLGGEIEKDWFQDNFKGKKIWSLKEQKLTPIAVVKGKAADIYKDEAVEYHVDGITAATITGQGVTDMMDRWIKIYDVYLSKFRQAI